jgi:hypothetical protein
MARLALSVIYVQSSIAYTGNVQQIAFLQNKSIKPNHMSKKDVSTDTTSLICHFSSSNIPVLKEQKSFRHKQ